MKIRQATLSDARGIARVHVEAWRAAYSGVMPDETLAHLSVDERMQMWVGILTQGDSHVYVLDHRSRVAGFVSFGESRDKDAVGRTAEIYAIYLLPPLWGGGHGRLLMARAVEEMSALGFDLASLWVLEGNHRARRFYEGFGMNSAGQQLYQVSGVALPKRRYSIELSAEVALG